jgi:hypothetical protein
VTPTPATWDADTRLESSPRKSLSSVQRAALVMGGLTLVGILAAIRAAQSDSNEVAVGAPSADTTTAPPPPSAPVVVAPAEPVKKAYSLGDLPDVSPSAGATSPKPAVSSGPRLRSGGSGAPLAGEPGKKPKPGEASDPFAGRRQ